MKLLTILLLTLSLAGCLSLPVYQTIFFGITAANDLRTNITAIQDKMDAKEATETVPE